jgi:hypothetical protein
MATSAAAARREPGRARGGLQSLMAAAPSTLLIHHSGGRIMPSVNIHVIFWLPPKLQSGSAASLQRADHGNTKAKV